MNKKEVVAIAQLITTAYPNATFPKEKLELWAEMLGPYEYEVIQRNAKKHILHSEFAPVIADLVKIPATDEKPSRNVSQRSLKDVKTAEKEAEDFLRSLGELDV